MAPARTWLLLAVAGALVAAGLAYGLWTEGPDEAAAPYEGAIVVGGVQNDFTERIVLHVITLDERNETVSALPSVLDPGQGRGPDGLPCSDEGRSAKVLWVALRTEGEGGAEDDVYLPLEPSDCKEGGGSTFNVTATPEGTIAVEESRAR